MINADLRVLSITSLIMVQTVVVPAPTSGTVDAVRVKKGDTVAAGDLLATQVLTKAETQIASPAAGVVKSIVEKGVTLQEGETVAEIETA